MTLDVLLGSFAALAIGRGTVNALRGRAKASSWLAAGAACLLALSGRFPGSYQVTGVLVALGVVSASAAGGVLVREIALKRDRRTSLDIADDAALRELRRDVGEDAAQRGLFPPEDVDV